VLYYPDKRCFDATDESVRTLTSERLGCLPGANHRFARDAGAVDHACVSQLRLAIDLASEPITGSVSVDGETSRRFNGWIELVAAIEAARRRTPREAREARATRANGAAKDWGCSLG
jgi:hypothetical protein